MRVEVRDRAAWLQRVEARISAIKSERRKRDMEYEDEWRSSVFGGRLLLMIWPNAKPSPVEFEYPSIYSFVDLNVLNSMRRVLMSTEINAIFFESDELAAAGVLAEPVW
ncbi:hypothetical protein AWB80_08150 [Caballeronia pedi]|uniref:Uncharacterized protein n=1 Tax=Caballeronia pedi TaxID=1777141 RepID=A0A158E6H0_9BURK|nr:hypothetical protein [Caballeronia pedi]SAL01547.1 hypothetical protein AWB80_08150 [Caballeronia pedi]